MSSEHQHSSTPGKRHKVEGPYKHYLTYVFSIILTIFAFVAVIYGGLDKQFLFIYLLVLGVIQALFQVYVWMHGKDKGHALPLLFLAFGGVIAITAVIAAEYWMWW